MPRDTSHHLRPPLPEDDDRHKLIDCPKCRAPMKQIRVGQVIVDRCHGCAGLWLDALEKDKLLADRGSVAKADHPPEGRLSVSRPSLKCPRDKSDLICMTDPVQRHVLFESCTVCGGVFLDAGELTDLSEHTLRERIFGR